MKKFHSFLFVCLLLSFATTISGQNLVISEFRVRGPNGANDEFIEIYNNSNTDHTVAGGGTGYAVAASNGVARFVIPNGTIIPARGHYLGVNSVGYSLASYPAGNGTTATGDATYTTDIPDNAGIAIFNTSVAVDFTLANRFDAVGSTSEANTIYKEGAGYPALTPFSIDYCFHRRQMSGLPLDTDNNATDFKFEDTNGTSAGAGQSLGAPGPENLSSPISYPGGLVVVPLDNAVAGGVPPNAVRDFTSDPANNSTFGTTDLRLKITNNTGANVTRLRFRIVDLSTFPSPSGIADLRPRTSTAVVVTTSGGNVTVQGTTLEQPPSQPNGGGINSSMSVGIVTLATPLANGASENIRILLGLQQTGNIKLDFLVEALPQAGGGNAGSGSGTSVPISYRGTDAAPVFGLCPTITVTNPATTTGTAGAAFSQTFTQSGGTGTITYTTSSTLPAGLTLATDGTLSGTPTQTGSFPITVIATDANSCTGTSASYALQINCAAVSVTNPATTTGTAGTAFSQTFTQSGGTAPLSFTTASTLPTGLTLAANGTLSGTPTQSGSFPIVVTVTDTYGCTADGASYPLQINCPSLTHTNVLATPASVCLGSSTVITGTANGGVVSSPTVTTTSSGTINLAITDNTPAGVNSTIIVPAAALSGASSVNVRLNIRHSWVGDLKLTLTSPCGVTFLLDQPGVPASTFGNSNNLGTSTAATPPPAVYTFDVSAASIIPETALAAGFIPTGNYRPSNTAGAAHNYTGFTFPCAAAGNWTLNLSDNGAGDLGLLVDWAIITTSGGTNYTHSLTGPGTITQNPSSGANDRNASFNVAALPVGNHSFTLISTDPLGCSVTTTPINVVVNALPTITCPANITRNSDPGICGAVVTFAASATGSPAPAITYSPASGSVFPVGTTTVTATATNACGTATCTFTVTVVDNQPPVITCPANITVGTDAGLCTAVVNFTVGSTDNCASATLTQSTSNTVVPGSVSCNAATLHAENSYWRAYQLALPAPVAVNSVTFGIETANASGTGTTQPVIVRVYTSAGAFPGAVRTQVASQTFNIPDQSNTLFTAALTTPPTVPGNAILVLEVNTPDGQAAGHSFFIGSNSLGQSAPSYLSATACGITAPTTTAAIGFPTMHIILNASVSGSVPVVSVPASGSIFPIGTTTVTSTATDAAGNSSQCTFTVTVNDTQAPTVTCPANVTRTTDPGVCTATFAPANPTAADNCGVTVQTWALTGATVATSPATGINTVGSRAFNLGVTTVTYTVRDAAGNTGTCSFTVTITDLVLPVISVQPVNRTVCAGTTATFSVTAVTAPTTGGPLAYQWEQWNGTAWVNAPGASTASTYSVAGTTQSMNTNTFRVRVTGLCTTVSSSAATLFVNALPTISLTSSNSPVLLPGQITSIIANVSPTGGTFAWFKNGAPRVPTVTTGTLSNLTVDDAGTYRATYTDPNGCVATSGDLVISAEVSDKLIVAPNPNFGQFWVRYYNQTGEPLTVIVFDSKGRRVHQQQSATTLAYTRIDVDMGVQAAGIYTVELRGTGGRVLGRKQMIVAAK